MVTICSKKAMESGKPVIFMIGRVHSGATPSSHMIQGVLDKLTNFDDSQAEKLLENYIF